LTLRRKIRWVPALALSLLLVVAAALFLLTMPPFGASAASASSVSGHVEMQSAGATAWSLLHSGTALQSGDVLSTGEDGSLLVAYPDGSTTTLQPNTLMALNELRSRSRTVALDLRSGETANYVASAGLRRALFEITTPSAVVSSYAANFRVGVDQFGATYAVVDSGEIAISAAGSVLNLRAGQQAYVPADQPPHLLSPDPSPTPVPSPTIAPSTTAQPTVPADSPPSSPQPTIEPLPPPAVVPPGPPGDRPPREDRPGHDAGNDDDDRGDDDEDNHGDSGDNEDDDD
jgi:hypothetical protein